MWYCFLGFVLESKHKIWTFPHFKILVHAKTRELLEVTNKKAKSFSGILVIYRQGFWGWACGGTCTTSPLKWFYSLWTILYSFPECLNLFAIWNGVFGTALLLNMFHCISPVFFSFNTIFVYCAPIVCHKGHKEKLLSQRIKKKITGTYFAMATNGI